MAVTAWRIVKARHAASAFDGEGARVEGGRWNSPGTPVVYTSQSAALATIELLVHLGRGSILAAYVLIPCTFDEALISRLDRKRLPRNWRSYPALPELQLIGDEWVKSGTSAVLEVPSAVIDTDSKLPFESTSRRLSSHSRHASATVRVRSSPAQAVRHTVSAGVQGSTFRNSARDAAALFTRSPWCRPGRSRPRRRPIARRWPRPSATAAAVAPVPA